MIPARRRLLACALAVVSCSAAGVARAQDVVALVSPAPGPYQAAFESFAKALGQPVAAYHMPKERAKIDSGVRVVVAFGGEAAVQAESGRATVIACLAPSLASGSRRGVAVMAMKPSAEGLLAKLRLVQPGLKRLGAFWNSEETGKYLKELKRAAASLGIEIDAVRVLDSRGIPEALRAETGKIDALWLAPDPTLVTPETFETIKQFSWDNRVPFYAPTAGLAAAGAAAAVSVGAQEAGRQAAGLALRALAGEPLPETLYPDRNELTVNLESAGKAGLAIAPDALERADKVIR